MKYIIYLIVTMIAFARCGITWANETKHSSSLEKIIENVRQNEHLYDNLDTKVQTIYDDFRKYKIKNNEKKNNFQAYKHRDYTISCVRQEGMFHTEVKGNTLTVGNETINDDRIRVSDRKVTRVYESHKIGNVISEYLEDGSLIRPHKILFGELLVSPLSTYLLGHEAMASYPSACWNQKNTLKNTYQGEADYHKLKCHKIWITSYHSGRLFARWEVWLAEARNYIPAKLLNYSLSYSKVIPVALGEVTSWREIKPGIWFPYESQMTAFDKLEIRDTGNQIPIWRYKYIVHNVTLDPKYNISYYRDLNFDVGSLVYDVSNKNIVRSYVEGAPSKSVFTISINTWWYNIIFILLIITIVVVFMIRRHKTNIN